MAVHALHAGFDFVVLPLSSLMLPFNGGQWPCSKAHLVTGQLGLGCHRLQLVVSLPQT